VPVPGYIVIAVKKQLRRKGKAGALSMDPCATVKWACFRISYRQARRLDAWQRTSGSRLATLCKAGVFRFDQNLTRREWLCSLSLSGR
jgi:hypothetical protein